MEINYKLISNAAVGLFLLGTLSLAIADHRLKKKEITKKAEAFDALIKSNEALEKKVSETEKTETETETKTEK